MSNVRFIGLDIHADTIAVAAAEPAVPDTSECSRPKMRVPVSREQRPAVYFNACEASKRNCLEVRVSEPKTKPTEVSAQSHIAAIAKEEQRNDAQTLLALMRRVNQARTKNVGASIVGFGSYHYSSSR